MGHRELYWATFAGWQVYTSRARRRGFSHLISTLEADAYCIVLVFTWHRPRSFLSLLHFPEFLLHSPCPVGAVAVVNGLPDCRLLAPDKSIIPHPIGHQLLRDLHSLPSAVEWAWQCSVGG